MIASTGWTWDYIAKNVDIPRLNAMKAYWNKNPPVHLLVKWYLYGSDKDEPQGSVEGGEDLGDLLAAFPQVQR